MKPQGLIADVAAEQIGVHETSPNQGPGIEKYWAATTYPDGMQDRQPWCSAFASWCVQEADRRSEQLRFPIPPRWPAVAQWLDWARDPAVGALVFKPFDSLHFPSKGDIVIYLPRVSHVGIVESFDGRQVTTIEGNTNDTGGRDGVAVLRKERALAFCGCFIRLPAAATPV